ncbi:hypothetical protein PHLCEN_2v12928 [Hermanssonia centrifuga]|uniref:Peripheral subunit-binding (PSBD) domain-containing protein n=1 Tax=Hermanssonia centrifuga TaxID=98765 RepID=A0A2R6NFS4_9APHY|nr:hypothetical protein PHLCEN_2v12928 [Hermanssonia centrifuga]
MSPTMTEGGIASWKKKEGEAFSAACLSYAVGFTSFAPQETDKATIDVEAQEDGIMGKILAPDGAKNIPVGKTIALLAEEGDDISNLEAPKEDEPAPPKSESSSSNQSQAPSPPSDKSGASPSVPPSRPQTGSTSHDHSNPNRRLFPSVMRLLQENNIAGADADKIKGTGVRGMLTKGDVLTYLGKASGPMGSFKATLDKDAEQAKNEKTLAKKPAQAPAPLDGPALRRLIATQMLETSRKAYKPAPGPVPDFDDIIADYLPSPPKTTAAPSPPSSVVSKPQGDVFQGLY